MNNSFYKNNEMMIARVNLSVNREFREISDYLEQMSNQSAPINGIRRVLTRRSLKTNSEGGESLEEQFAIARSHKVEVRICPAQGASRLIDHVAFDAVRTTAGEDARGLVWQMLGGIHNFVFDCDLVPGMFAVLDFFNLPNLFCHHSLLTLIYPV
jgi:hypothetical protein